MGETISEIEQGLAETRGELAQNLSAVHAKTVELMDWRQHYRQHPAQFLGAALAGGVVLGIIAGAPSSRRTTTGTRSDDGAQGLRSRAANRVATDWERISDALMGVASAKVVEWVGHRVPGFNDVLKRD